jgi:hypothetical protein
VTAVSQDDRPVCATVERLSIVTPRQTVDRLPLLAHRSWTLCDGRALLDFPVDWSTCASQRLLSTTRAPDAFIMLLARARPVWIAS